MPPKGHLNLNDIEKQLNKVTFGNNDKRLLVKKPFMATIHYTTDKSEHSVLTYNEEKFRAVNTINFTQQHTVPATDQEFMFIPQEGEVCR